jgi:hypothetical protein
MKTIRILTIAALTAGIALPTASYAGDDNLDRVLFRILEGNIGHSVLRDGYGGHRHVVRAGRDDDDDDGFRRGGRAFHRDDDDDDDGGRDRNDDDD